VVCESATVAVASDNGQCCVHTKCAKADSCGGDGCKIDDSDSLIELLLCGLGKDQVAKILPFLARFALPT
jgi:hypothetical protein